MKIIAIVGSRDYPLLHLVRGKVHDLHHQDPSFVLVSGGARGVDSEAEGEARLLGHRVLSYRPQGLKRGGYVVDLVTVEPWGETIVEKAVYDGFSTYREAAFERNEVIAHVGHEIVAFWTGRSMGTLDTIEHAKKLHKPLLVYGPSGELMRDWG